MVRDSIGSTCRFGYYEHGRRYTIIVVDIRRASYYSAFAMSTPFLPDPTEAELDVLRILWDLGPSTVKEVFERLQSTKQVGYTTVLKQLQVMHRKGLVLRSERFRSHLYEPARTREETRRNLATTLLRQAFDGSARSLIQSALAGRKVSAKELAEIRQLLDQAERAK